MTSGASAARDDLIRQLDTAWALTAVHLDGLTTEACLWRPADDGLHVRRHADGRWRAEWPLHDGDELGPPSIAWLTWHLGCWWSMVLDHAFGDATLTRESVLWPGTADGVRAWIGALHAHWRERVDALTDDELRSVTRTRWPFADRPFGDVVAWASAELTRDAAALEAARGRYAVRAR